MNLSASRVILFLSGLFNVGMGLFLAFFSEQPSGHLALASHSRIAYISYVFEAHGFLVAQLGFLELFVTLVLAVPIAYVCAAFIVLLGDLYFGLSVWRIISAANFVANAGEPEMAIESIYYAATEGVLMLLILYINWPRHQNAKRK